MANMRKCPKCGKIENSYTYFCTDCGSKTVEYSNAESNQQTAKDNVKLDPPINNFEVTTQNTQLTSVNNEAPNRSDKNETKRNFEWKKMYTYICLGVGVCIIIAFGLSHLVSSDNVKSSQETDFEENINVSNVITDSSNEQEVAFSDNKETEVDNYDDQETLEEDEINGNSETEYFANYEEENGNVINDLFPSITSDTIEDYVNALDISTQYARMSSSIYSEFNFIYPKYLYNNVEVISGEYENIYGMIVEGYHFYGSKGSELGFYLIRRNDNDSVESFTEYVHNIESSRLYGAEDILYKVKDGQGKVIVTGYKNSDYDRPVYSMTKIEDEYVMQMEVIYPEYINLEDKCQKWYMVECMYRMCGFSDSSYPARSYTEYAENFTWED